MARTITPGQANLLRTVAAERVMSPEYTARLENALAEGLPSFKMQATLEWLKRQPKLTAPVQVEIPGLPGVFANAPAPAIVRITEPGFYRNEDGVYKVVKAIHSSNLYAQKVTSKGFVYDRGAFFKLSADSRMTPEEVRQHGCQTGVCANCSAELSDPISVEIGLGTTCGPNILGSESYKAHKAAAKLVPAVAEALAAIKVRKAAEKVVAA